MSSRRFLSALACICTSAATAAAAGSAPELEVPLAQAQALYLRLDIVSGTLQVMARGMELHHYPVQGVRLVVRRAPGGTPPPPEATLPASFRVAGEPEVAWRAVVAPPTLVPYDEDAEPPTPVPDADIEVPAQISVGLDNGWALHLGPDPPTGWMRRVADRLGSGWRRVWGRAPEVPPPALVVGMRAEDSQALLHVIRDGTPLLVVCGGEGPGSAAAAPAG
ncbi:MAG TPA: hypothetical protein VLT81_00850 [Chondromyces sp.]|nr:hypothetical protein [Chondromyces sp.]